MSNVIEGFEQLTEEQCIDMSVRHVLKNGRPSMDEKLGGCTYKGIGCGAAPFLTPKGRKTYRGLWANLVYYGDVPMHNDHVIIRLQQCHDRSASADDFIGQYKRAIRLTFPAYEIPEILG